MFTCFCFASDKFGVCDRAFFRRERFECGAKSRVVKFLLLFDKSTLRIVVSGYLPLMSFIDMSITYLIYVIVGVIVLIVLLKLLIGII